MIIWVLYVGCGTNCENLFYFVGSHLHDRSQLFFQPIESSVHGTRGTSVVVGIDQSSRKSWSGSVTRETLPAIVSSTRASHATQIEICRLHHHPVGTKNFTACAMCTTRPGWRSIQNPFCNHDKWAANLGACRPWFPQGNRE